MAQKTVVLFTDDLDGGQADQTVTFALDQVMYQIDLSGANAAALRELLELYSAAGRRLGSPAAAHVPRGWATGPARSDRAQTGAIRAWARARGLAVGDRGRIPRHIVEAYNNPGTAAVAP